MVTLTEILDGLETDLSDRVVQRHVNEAEAEVRTYISSTERATLPVVIWTGRYTPTLGASAVLTLPASILTFSIVRFEGTVAVAPDTPAYTADTEELNQDGGTDTLTPVTEDGIAVAAGAYVSTIDSTGTMLTVDATLTTAAVTITRILGLQQAAPPVRMVGTIHDLVELAVEYGAGKGLEEEEVGQYDRTYREYVSQRVRILSQLIYGGNASIAS